MFDIYTELRACKSLVMPPLRCEQACMLAENTFRSEQKQNCTHREGWTDTSTPGCACKKTKNKNKG